MRTAVQGCVRVSAGELSSEEVTAEFVILSGYCMHAPGFTQAVVKLAHEVR